MTDHEKISFILFKTISNFLLIGGVSFVLYSLYPAVFASAQTVLGTSPVNQRQIRPSFADTLPRRPSFGDILKMAPPLQTQPVNKDSSIVIEKIAVNSPIIWNVSVLNENAYMKALNLGVAQAADTAYPDQKGGNVFLFDHSTLNPWEVAKYAAVFTPLKNLQKDDRIVIFYQGRRFDYLVSQKEIVSKNNVEPLTQKTQEPTLTLMTCDPPGVDLNRLIVTAKRVAVY